MLESAVVHNCFPRDNRALVFTAKNFGVSLPIAEATDEINRHQVPRLVEKILNLLPQNGRVSVLGLSYKPDTDVVEKSQGLEVAKALLEKKIPLIVYDPAVAGSTKNILRGAVFADSLKEAVKNSDMVVITIPWKEFLDIEPDWLKPGAILIDCWRQLNSEKYGKKVKYLGLGINYQL